MIYPIIIVKDRYQGAYSQAERAAWNEYDVPEDSQAGDVPCCIFWSYYKGNCENWPKAVGRGTSPQDAHTDLLRVIKGRYDKGVTTLR